MNIEKWVTARVNKNCRECKAHIVPGERHAVVIGSLATGYGNPVKGSKYPNEDGTFSQSMRGTAHGYYQRVAVCAKCAADA
jgi:hypothetical protein